MLFLIKIERFIKVGDFLRSKSLIFERLKRIFMVVVKLFIDYCWPLKKTTPHSPLKDQDQAHFPNINLSFQDHGDFSDQPFFTKNQDFHDRPFYQSRSLFSKIMHLNFSTEITF